MPDQEFEHLKEISQRIGDDIRYVQGAGGNTSIKLDDRVMMVKASGKWLGQAIEEEIFVAVDWADINQKIAMGRNDVLRNAGVRGQFLNLRPSIETTLHSLMPQRVVLHTHSVNTIAHAIRVDGEEFVGDKLRRFDWAFVPYSKPGFPLTRLVAKVLEEGSSDVLMIQNHGLVVGGDTAEEAFKLMLAVEDALFIEAEISASWKSAGLKESCKHSTIKFADADLVNRLSSNRTAIEVATGGSLYPDHVVFLGSGLVAFDTIEEGLAFLGNDTDDPLRSRGAIIRNKGVLHHKQLPAAGIEMLKAIAEVASRFPETATAKYLTKSEELELVNWDAEKYRKALEKV